MICPAGGVVSERGSLVSLRGSEVTVKIAEIQRIPTERSLKCNQKLCFILPSWWMCCNCDNEMYLFSLL